MFLCELVHVRVGDMGLCGDNKYYDKYPRINIKYQARESTVSVRLMYMITTSIREIWKGACGIINIFGLWPQFLAQSS